MSQKYIIYTTLIFVTLFTETIKSSYSTEEEIDAHKTPSSKPIYQNKLAELQKKIAYQFKNTDLLTLALRHQAKDIGHTPSSRGYERLEFFGDSVLELVIREMLFFEFPHLDIKKIKKTCSILVDSKRLSSLSDLLELPEASKCLQLSPINSCLLNEHSKADYVESLIGAIHKDGGLMASKAFIHRFWSSENSPPNLKVIFEDLLTSYDLSLKKNRHQPSKKILRRLMYQADQSLFLSFLGDSVLKYVIRDLLCNRFPDNSEGELVQKYNSLIQNPSIELMCSSFNLANNKNDFEKFLGILYLDVGLEQSSNYIVWYWTNPRSPQTMRDILRKKKGSIEKKFINFIDPTLKITPHPSQLLQELVSLGLDNPTYVELKEGEDHDPEFTVTIDLQSVGKFEGKRKKKIEACNAAKTLALDHLTSKILANFITSDKDFLRDEYSADFLLKVIESKLLYLGLNPFSYHILATKTEAKKTIYRIEIQGQTIFPSTGEASDIKTAQFFAGAHALTSLLKEEYEKIKISVLERHKQTLNDELLRFYFQICTNIIKEMALDYRFEPIRKKGKSDPVLHYQLSCADLSIPGKGFTPLQAQLNAAIEFIHTKRPELDLKVTAS